MRYAPWLAEERVDARRASALIARHFGLTNLITPLGEGWDSAAYQLDDAVFRFPKRADIVPHLRSEIAVLPELEGLPLSVPRPMWVAEPDEDYPFPFMGYPLLPGVPLTKIDDLEEAEIDSILDQLLAFLDALHALPLTGARTHVEGWPLRPPSRYPHPVADRARAWLANVASPPEARVLLHADLGLDHVLVDPHTRMATGIVDFGDLDRGDPALDLVGLLCWQPARVAARRDPDEIARAWAYAVHFGLQDCVILAHWRPLCARAAWDDLAWRLDQAETRSTTRP